MSHSTGVPAVPRRVVPGGVRDRAHTSQVLVLRDVHHLPMPAAVRRPADGVHEVLTRRRTDHSSVLLMVFLLPADSGEKVSLGVSILELVSGMLVPGVSILVAISVFLLLVANNVPNTSDDIPLLGQQHYELIRAYFTTQITRIRTWSVNLPNVVFSIQSLTEAL